MAQRKIKTRHLLFLLLCTFIFSSCDSNKDAASTDDDIAAFKKLRTDLTAAFRTGDVKTITAYHHPNVIKSLSYDNLLVGRDANMASLQGTLQAYSLNFKEHKIESFEIHGNTATEISSFTMEGTPKGDSKPFTFKGRSNLAIKNNKL